MAKAKSGHRIQSKTSLAKAVELIASDKAQDSTKKPVRWYFKIDRDAARILLQITGIDANQGWQVLRSLDDMNLYGSQIPLAFNKFCQGDQDKFVVNATSRNMEMARWVDKQRETIAKP